MIVTVTANPALDLTLTVHGLELGESQRVDTGRMRAGGKGINVARVAHQLGYDVTALATVGGAPGREFKADLASAGIAARLVSVAGDTRRSVAIIDDARRQTTVLNERGSRLNAEESERILAELESLLTSGPGCVCGSGSLPPGAPDAFYARVASAARSRGIPCVIDATGPTLLRAAEAGAAVLKPNLSELTASTGESDPRAGALCLLDAGAGAVFVSLGEDGMLAVSAERRSVVWHARLEQPLDGNPTGAGDAAVAAIATAMAAGVTDLVAILRRATAWSAAAVLMPQAGELAETYSELESALTVEQVN